MNAQSQTPPTARLGDLSNFNPSAPHLRADEVVAFVPMACVSELGTMQNVEHLAVADLKSGYSYMQSGDVLVAKITPCFENNKIAVTDLDRRHGFGSTEFHVIRPKPSALDNRYLVHFLRQDSVRDAGERRMTGSAGQRRVPRQFLEELAIPLPPLDEQRRIAAILDQADDLRRKRREALERLEAFKSISFEAMFLGDQLTSFPSGVIDDLTASTQYGTSSKAGEQGQYPILRMGNLSYAGEIETSDLKYIDLPPADVAKYTVTSGDILFNRTNSPELVGKTAVFRNSGIYAFAGYLVRLRVNERAVPEFIAAYLNSKRGKSILRGMCKAIIGMANINAKELRRVPIPLPPLDLQRAFAARVAAIDALKAQHRAQLAKLDALFASLQHRAFRGEL